jgi:hypothetical protein
MANKAIVKLCMCLVLVLLTGVATSAWSQTATSGSSIGKAKGTLCGGIGGLKCPEGQACRYPVNMCNVADLAGTCVKVPVNCPKKGHKVCGCDGTTYANQCELLKAGAREAHKGACKKK